MLLATIGDRADGDSDRSLIMFRLSFERANGFLNGFFTGIEVVENNC
jgi:hypothetical protein